MTTDFLKRLLLFFVFILAQVVVFGGIHLFNCSTPLLYVYFVTMFPRNYPKWGVLLWSFVMGLLIDMFFNTPGLASASLTLIAAVQPYYLELFVSRESADDIEISIQTVGPLKYTAYIVVLVFIYCLIFYSLEMFNFLNLLQWVMCVVGSALITLVLIFTFEIARSNN